MNWLKQHPEFVTMVAIPIVTALLNAFLRKRTPEEYAAMPQRVAGLLRLLAAVFPDPGKAIDAARQMIMNQPPSNPTQSVEKK